MAGLGERLHEAARGGVFARYGVDRQLVAEVAQLEGGVEAAVDASGGQFGGGAFGEGATAVAPALTVSVLSAAEEGGWVHIWARGR